jgi:hypothetical protein
LKILALLCPREHMVEQRNLIKSLSDQELESMIEYLKTSLEAQADGPVKVIEGTTEPAAATAHAPKPKNRLMLEADTAVGPRERIPRKSDRQRTSDLYDMARRLLRTGGSSVRRDGSCPTIVSSSKVLETVGRQFSVPDRVLNVLVPEVVRPACRGVSW